MGVSTMGSRISEAREDLGLTQAELADRLGVSRSYIADIETDRRSISKVFQLEAFADVLQKTPTYILNGYQENALLPGKDLGLSDLAIYQLHLQKEHDQLHAAFVVNTILENPILFESLYEYLTADFTHVLAEDPDTHEIIRVPSHLFGVKNALFSSLTLNDFEPLVRLSVMDLLKKTREEVHNGKS